MPRIQCKNFSNFRPLKLLFFEIYNFDHYYICDNQSEIFIFWYFIKELFDKKH